jgi:hypothetical protein
VLVWVLLAAAITVVSIFNYFLNLAPGSDPEDFRVGPRELGATCDCFLNTLILGSIMVVSLAAASGAFPTRNELIVAGALSFGVVTLAGILGRVKRHREWKETRKAIQRAVPVSFGDPYDGSSVRLIFDDEDEEDDSNYDS